MKSLRALVPVVTGLLLVLTYFLVQGAAPDPVRHERTLDALRIVILHSAALQRDVLRARAGLLRSYDPFVRSIENLRAATGRLAAAREVADGEARATIDRKIADVAAAVGDQEALIEAFKSDNALLQNSLTYFNHLSGRLAAAGDSLHAVAPAEVGAVTTAMLRFVGDPRPDAAGAVTASLDRLARQPILLTRDMLSLVAHGRLIVATLPAVDDLVARLQAGPIGERARALQGVYLDAHRRSAARAGFYRTLLYVAALVLVAYVAYLFARLRANARVLRERLEFEDLIASISTQFINLPRDLIRADVEKGLARLVEHASLDGAQIIACRAGEADFPGSCSYRRPTRGAPGCRFEEVLELALTWSLEGYERQGCIYVPDVQALPASREKASLQARQVRSWLCIPMWCAGERLGFLALDAVTDRKNWPDDDIALLRTAAEIFANAMARERTESERQGLQARLDQSQRLEAIGTLAGGIAHEFNNILGAILGYGEMTLAELRRGSPARRHVGQIMKAGQRAQRVVEQVLTFGRRRERQYRPMRAEPAVADAIDFIRASLPATVAVRTRLQSGDAAIMGDPTELQQVVMNLGANSAHALDGRGTIEVELDTIEADDRLTLSHGDLAAGHYVRLAVTDTGHGIDQATMERIFEPFFTTKPVGQGTGLGLSTVHGIAAGHGGAVSVRSRPGEGTTVEVYFPRMDGDVPDEDRTVESLAHRGDGETVLIVDEDRALVLLGEEMLAALGYEPVGFQRSTAALTAFRGDPGRFDLVLVDEIMPEMTGTELAGALHEIRPDLPIVLMTGYDRPLQSDRLQVAGIREVLRKPLLSRPLADCLARQLRATAEACRETRGRSAR
jgi:signal transduction histidine kinase/CheY-like chemotaxis protein